MSEKVFKHYIFYGTMIYIHNVFFGYQIGLKSVFSRFRVQHNFHPPPPHHIFPEVPPCQGLSTCTDTGRMEVGG